MNINIFIKKIYAGSSNLNCGPVYAYPNPRQGMALGALSSVLCSVIASGQDQASRDPEVLGLNPSQITRYRM